MAEDTPYAKASPPNISDAPTLFFEAGPGKKPRISTAAVEEVIYITKILARKSLF